MSQTQILKGHVRLCLPAAYLEVGSALAHAALHSGVALKLVCAAGVLVAQPGHLPAGEGSLQHGGRLDATEAVVVEAHLENNSTASPCLAPGLSCMYDTQKNKAIISLEGKSLISYQLMEHDKYTLFLTLRKTMHSFHEKKKSDLLLVQGT